MEQRAEYTVQTTHPLHQPVTRHGKKATLRVRARAKMFRGQSENDLAWALLAEVRRLTKERDEAWDKSAAISHDLIEHTTNSRDRLAVENARLRRALNAAEELIDELDRARRK